MRPVSDPEHDPTTLFIPQKISDNFKSLSFQYWEIKRKNYDKIVLFKNGQFYQIQHEDAVICHKLLGLNWFGRYVKVGFPEKNLEKNVAILVKNDYKVAIIEQTETPKDQKKRISQVKKSRKIGKHEHVLKREMVQVMTKGTFFDSEKISYDQKFILCIQSKALKVSVVLVESTTNKIIIGNFIENDKGYNKLKKLLSETQPLEIIYSPKKLDDYIINILKTCFFKPLLTVMNKKNAWKSVFSKSLLESTFKQDDDQVVYPPIINEVLEKWGIDEREFLLKTISAMFLYLKDILILNKVIQTSEYKLYDPSEQLKNYMIIDSQAQQHLDLTQTSYSGSNTKNKEQKSLFSWLDYTVTASGKRQLKRWLLSPLLNVNLINDRLDAIGDLRQNPILLNL